MNLRGPNTIVVTIPELGKNHERRVSAEPQYLKPSAPMRKQAALPAFETRSPRPERNRQAAIGWVTFGTGLGGMAVGSGLGIRAAEKRTNSDELCRTSDPKLCSARRVDLREEAEDFSTYSVVALATGGAFAAGGLVLVLTAPEQGVGTSEVRLAARFGKAPVVTLEGTF